ncbi:DUF1007 family protein [Pelobacter propionicus]|nr:DUF1007 family protein [Pelobacter propionicus]
MRPFAQRRYWTTTVKLSVIVTSLFLIILTGISKECHAHPHVFIDCSIRLEFSGGKLTGIIEKWSFDEMFSSMILMDYSKNGSGNIDSNKIAALKKEYFDKLAKDSFFTKMYIDNKVMKFNVASNFVPTVEDGKLIFSFKLNTGGVPIPSSGASVTVYDDTYYNSIEIAEAGVAGLVPSGLKLKKGQFKEVAYYFGQVHPDAVRLQR